MKKLVIILIGIFILGNVLYNYFTRKTVTAEYPLSSVVNKPSSVSIYLDKKANLSDIINMSLFKGINPTMGEDSIIKMLGKPRDEVSKQGIKFLVYYTEDGRIEFDNDSGTLADESYHNTNSLSFYRQNMTTSFVFKQNVEKYLPESLEGMQVGVYQNNNCALVINFSKDEEDWIQWTYEVYQPPTN